MRTWSQIVEGEFPEDEDEFEESISFMKARLEEIIFDESHRYRTEYFLTGYESAYKIIASWFNDLRSFKNVYDEANKETYMEMRTLFDEESCEEAKEEAAFLLLEKSIPDELTETERGLYDHLWLLRWYHDVVFHLRPYDELFQEGEYTMDNFDQWVQDWVSYDRLDLYSVCADVYEYLYLKLPRDKDFGSFAQAMLTANDVPRSFFALLEERKGQR